MIPSYMEFKPAGVGRATRGVGARDLTRGSFRGVFFSAAAHPTGARGRQLGITQEFKVGAQQGGQVLRWVQVLQKYPKNPPG